MFFFNKPSGIYLTEQEIVLVQLKRSGKIPVIHKVVKEPLPEGAVLRGVIQDEAAVVAALKKMKAQVKTGACVVGLPVHKCYSTAVHFPVGMKDELLQKSIVQQSSNYIPVPLSDLRYQTTVVRGIKENSATAFISGIEKSVLNQFKKVFTAAGFSRCSFVLENMALIKAIPVKLGTLPNLMFVHNFDHTFLISSVVQGQVFDGVLTHQLEESFQNSYTAFSQQIGTAPSHIIVSGDQDSLKEINMKDLGKEPPKFIQAEFKVKVEGDVSSSYDLIVPIGLALSYGSARKKNGIQLLTLLD